MIAGRRANATRGPLGTGTVAEVTGRQLCANRPSWLTRFLCIPVGPLSTLKAPPIDDYFFYQ